MIWAIAKKVNIKWRNKPIDPNIIAAIASFIFLGFAFKDITAKIIPLKERRLPIL